MQVMTRLNDRRDAQDNQSDASRIARFSFLEKTKTMVGYLLNLIIYSFNPLYISNDRSISGI